MRIRFILPAIVLFPVVLLISGCVLFDDIEYEASDDDYWATGSCPGNTATDPTVVSQDCRDITLQGCCDRNGNTLYCYQGQLYCKSCAYNAPSAGAAFCSWSSVENGYWCTETNNGIDPSGTIAIACPAF